MNSERPEERPADDARGDAGGATDEQERPVDRDAGPSGGGDRADLEATGEAGSAEAERQAMEDRYLRLAAEYDNYRKRTERERTESWVRAQSELVKKLLDGLDDLQRVADYTVEGTPIETLLEGVQMVERKLLRALETSGLEMIDPGGHAFDPAVHEALMTAPADSPAEDESVGEVLQKGYAFKGMLLRPARVQVRKYEG